jgi:hypothetical protein
MYEESEYKVNLKYRLKREGSYVVGDDNHWVSADELVTAYKSLASKKSDSYSLEWKWFDDDGNDTIAGEKMRSLYKLYVELHFEQI